MSAHAFSPDRPPPRADAATGRVLQRKCSACGSHKGAGESCAACDEQAQSLQRRSLPADGAWYREAPRIVQEVLGSPGNPLSEAERAFFEPRFGHDFSAVRVHADTRAAASARAVDADAYTVGNRIVFADGRRTGAADNGLLAHELVHVLQQSGERLIPRGPLMVSGPNDAAEPEADTGARRAMLGRAARVNERVPPRLMRQGSGRSGPGGSQVPSPNANPGMPTVVLGHFRNRNQTSPDNDCPNCPLTLGESWSTGENVMEIRGDIHGAVATASYDFVRTRENGFWMRVGPTWLQLEYSPPGTFDDIHNDDEDLMPHRNRIYVTDTPGIRAPPSNVTGHSQATDFVYKGSFEETCHVRLGAGPWSQRSNVFPWHSITWYERTPARTWRRKPGSNRIAPGAITVGSGSP